MKMGEQPSTVFVVGGLGVESIANLKIIPRGQLQQELGITFEPLTALVSYHPDTIKSEESGIQINSLIAALDKFPEIALIITGSNADNGGTLSTLLLKGYSESRENAVFFENLGQTRFLSSLSYVDFIIGNSSSGLLEAPSMKIGTVNLGNRQSGRPRAISVVDADFNPSNIEAAIKHVISDEFKKTLANCTNPYGKTGASVKILEILETIDFHQLLPKQFYDEGGMTHDAS
jgi:GDP/UDP-N,N'-diacetylbacillosamine 2-epimerase (hydrolysing)